MAWEDESFPQVRMSKEDYEAYMEWSIEFQNTFKTRFHKGHLAELIRTGTNCINQLKARQQESTRTYSKMYGGRAGGGLHLEVIRLIDEQFGYNKYEDKSLFKIPHLKIKNIIKNVFNIIDDRTIRIRRDEILSLLDLEVIQEKGRYFVVNKEYIPIINRRKR